MSMFYRFLSFILFVTFIFPSATYSAPTGAGVLPLFDDGTVLLGKETRYSNRLHKNIQVWSDFGGGSDPKDGRNLAKTGAREGNEETANTFTFTPNQVANSPYTDHNHPLGGSYRMYYVKVHGPKPSITDIQKNAQKLRWRKVEKSEWKYVSAQSLLKAVNTSFYPTLLPGTNEEIFAPTLAGLKQATAQSVLRNLIHSAKKKPAPVKTPAKRKPTPVKPPSKKKPTPVKPPAKRKTTPVKPPAKRKLTPVKPPAKRKLTPVKPPAKRKLTPVKPPA